MIVLLGRYGTDYARITEELTTKTVVQCRNYFSNYRRKLNLDKIVREFEENARAQRKAEAAAVAARTAGGKQSDSPQAGGAGDATEPTAADTPSPNTPGSASSSRGERPRERRDRRTSSFWTTADKEAFVRNFMVTGKDWAQLSRLMANVKTPQQMKNFYQNYKLKLNLDVYIDANGAPLPGNEPSGALALLASGGASSASAAATAASTASAPSTSLSLPLLGSTASVIANLALPSSAASSPAPVSNADTPTATANDDHADVETGSRRRRSEADISDPSSDADVNATKRARRLSIKPATTAAEELADQTKSAESLEAMLAQNQLSSQRRSSLAHILSSSAADFSHTAVFVAKQEDPDDEGNNVDVGDDAPSVAPTPPLQAHEEDNLDIEVDDDVDRQQEGAREEDGEQAQAPEPDRQEPDRQEQEQQEQEQQEQAPMDIDPATTSIQPEQLQADPQREEAQQ